MRRANFYGTALLDTVENLAKLDFWSERLDHVDAKRMEDREFISELLFFYLEGEAQKGTQKELDTLYTNYAVNPLSWEAEIEKFSAITSFLQSLELNYDEYKISGVSHLYALWELSKYCVDSGIKSIDISPSLQVFYQTLRGNPESNNNVYAYKKSMASSTRMKSKRVKRIQSLIQFLEI